MELRKTKLTFRYLLEKYTFAESDDEKRVYSDRMKRVTPYFVTG